MIVKCITMQKNEGHNLEAWMKYHSYLFGYENIYIIDNGSSDKKTIDLLNMYERMGCNISYKYNDKNSFEQKGNIINDIIREWDINEKYDYVIPIDCDEYIIYYDEQPSCSRELIFEYLDKVKEIKAPFLIKRMFLNVPSNPGFFVPREVPKSFFRKGTIGYLDHGFHHPISKNNEIPFDSKLSYIHLHNKSFRDVISAAKEKLCHLVDVNDLEALNKYSGHGEHLTAYFSMSESEYINKYSEIGNVYFPEFVNILNILGSDTKNIFGGEFINLILPKNHSYLVRAPSMDNNEYYLFGFFNKYQYMERNYDVRGVNIDPLWHFCEFGYKEYRPMNTSNSNAKISKEIFNYMNVKEINKLNIEIKNLNSY